MQAIPVFSEKRGRQGTVLCLLRGGDKELSPVSPAARAIFAVHLAFQVGLYCNPVYLLGAKK